MVFKKFVYIPVFTALLLNLSAPLVNAGAIVANDLKDKDIIKVEKQSDGRFNFTFCHNGNECHRLGTRAYSLEELNSLRRWEQAKAGGKIVADGLAAFVGFLAGFGVAAMLDEGLGIVSMTSDNALFAVSAATGSAIGGGAIALANPVENLRYSKILDPKIVDSDKTLRARFTTVRALANDLDNRLVKIPSAASSGEEESRTENQTAE